MQKILYIRIRIFLPPKLKILIYAYKKKRSVSDRFVFVLEGKEGSGGTVSLLPWHYIHPDNGVSLGMATRAEHPTKNSEIRP